MLHLVEKGIKNMFRYLIIGLWTFVLSACVIHSPSASSSVIETNEKGSLINISTDFCGVTCTELAMKKSQEVCPKGFIVKNQQGGFSDGYYKDVNLIIRCDH